MSDNGRLLRQTSPGWYVEVSNPDGPKVRKKPGDTIVTDDVTHTPPKTAPAAEPDLAQLQAKIHAYGTLKQAGVPIPPDLATEVEAWFKQEDERRQAEEKAHEKEQAKIREENKSGPWWVRNNYHAPFALRLERQEKKKRIELKPRGVRGDLHPLQEGDLDDPILQTSLNSGLIEVIPNGEAQNVISKQTTNLQRENVLIGMLRNEKGEPYAPENIKLEISREKQGVVVAYEDPSIGKQQENAHWRTNKNAGLIRAQPGQPRPEQVSQFVPTGGNPAIISDGFQQDRARIADDLARRKGAGGVEAGLGGLQVTVGPTQRT